MSEVASPVASDASPDHATLIDETLVSTDGRGRVSLECGRCADCGAESFPRAAVCAQCLSDRIEPFGLQGPGQLYAYSVVHLAPKHWDVPYAVGYVDFPGGLRVFGHIKGPFETLTLGAEMELELARLGTKGDGTPLTSYVFAARG